MAYRSIFIFLRVRLRRRKEGIGVLGERVAQKFLKKQHYKIIKTNWRYRRGELDIVAIQDRTLHVIEVKTRSALVARECSPLAAIDDRKAQQLHTLGHAFSKVYRTTLLRKQVKEIRYSLAEVYYLRDSLSKKLAFRVRLLKNIIFEG